MRCTPLSDSGVVSTVRGVSVTTTVAHYRVTAKFPDQESVLTKTIDRGIEQVNFKFKFPGRIRLTLQPEISGLKLFFRSKFVPE